MYSSCHPCHAIAVDFLEQFGVKATASPVTPACASRPSDPQDTAFQIVASDYAPIDIDVLLDGNFPEKWCMLASVNCDSRQAGTLIYYEDSDGFGYSMDISNGKLTFAMRNETYSATEQLCDGNWNQFSVCYDGETLIMSRNCANSIVLGHPSDPGLSTTTGTMTIFTSGSNDFSVSQCIVS